MSGLYSTNLVLGVILTANLVCFGWAMQRQFSRPHGVPTRMRSLTICGLVCALGDLWLVATADRLPVWRTAPAVLLCLIGLGVFYGASRATAAARLSLAFSPDSPTHLNRIGPYRHIRHPFYLAYSLTWIGAAIGLAHWLAWLPVVVMGSFYVAAARNEEAKFLNSTFAGQYREYMQQAGRFLPRVGNPRPSAGKP